MSTALFDLSNHPVGLLFLPFQASPKQGKEMQTSMHKASQVRGQCLVW